MSMSEILLEMAKKDLEASHWLNEKELYPQAIFFLQQSVEKAAKAFGLMTNMVTEDELQAIGHYPLRIHRRLLTKQRQKLKGLNRALGIIPRLAETQMFKNIDTSEVEANIDEWQQSLDSLTPDKLRHLSQDELIGLISFLRELEARADEISTAPPPVTAADFDDFKETMCELLDTLYEFDPEEVGKAKQALEVLDMSFLEQLVQTLWALLPSLLYIHFALFCLSTITFPHAVVARYPSSELNPLEIYKKSVPLVDMFGVCVQVMQTVLRKLQGFRRLDQ